MHLVEYFHIRDNCFFTSGNFITVIGFALTSIQRKRIKTCMMSNKIACMCEWPCNVLLLFIAVVVVLVARLCPTLCDPMDCGPPGFSLREIFQARTLEQVTFPSPVDFPDLGIEPTSLYVFCIGRWVLYHWCNLGSPFTGNLC